MFRSARTILMTLVTALAVTVPAVPATAVPATAGPPPGIVNVAHRGASAHAPENTIEALLLAARQGADMVEFDVRETRDHALILMHDTTLARTTDVESVHPGRAPWRVADFTLDEIRELDAGSWFGSAFRGTRVPTLREALRAMSRTRLGLLVEIKTPRLHPGIERRAAVELRRSWDGPLVVQSFDWDAMRAFHRLMPDVPVGLLGTPSPGELRGLAAFAGQINPPYRDLTRDYVRAVQALGMQVFTWTTDDPGVMRRLGSYRVDGILTNWPHVLARL
ncbi:glycerophosphodiester phosphodiesterase family protein [Nonomuraea sp. MCN248]|uniref:Glycerophosphodiester phosphodiesterase family protein n=1 Tax=Nonomuraea corallina TaxID=2989783 RepID=A0ABT4SN07_9ACTN|nr:glycerophosphodiester phosphodiesterase family protein [Nonomuraea corallina]MDA0638494.1 glycerophosphodiester phosphodiesterase family protein [Nonomuraea corallina]